MGKEVQSHSILIFEVKQNFENECVVKLISVGFYVFCFVLSSINHLVTSISMQQLLLLPLLCLSLFGYSQDINIPDPNFLQALIEKGVDTNGDGLIQNEEALDINNLQINNRQINNLEGIQAFENLTVLNCGQNNLDSIDISKNLMLRDFQCFSNNFLALDITQNLFIEKLNCNSNKLANLDLSQNSLLEDLECGNNDIINIDVSNNLLLDRFRCSGNLLEAIDISSNLELVIFECGRAIKSIDVSKNLKLEILKLHGSDITELDVSNNSLLKNLDCSSTEISEIDVTNNLLLERLICSANSLSEIDVSQNLLLDNLSFGQNNLTSIDISNNVLLERLACSYNQLTEIDLSQNLNLSSITCTHNLLSEIDISKQTELSYLNILGNNLAELNLSNNSLLTQLDVGSNDLVSLDVSNNPVLIGLDCASNNLTSLDVSNNLLLEELECGANLISNIYLENNIALKEFSCRRTSIANLDLSNNPDLIELQCYSTPLEFLNINNGSTIEELDTYNNADILTICLDQSELDYISSIVDQSKVTLLTDCSLAFGGDTYNITGNVNYSSALNCDTNKQAVENLYFNIENGTTSIYKPTYSQDIFIMKLPENDYAISLKLDNPDLFNFNPDTLRITLNAQNSPYEQDFCITPKEEERVDLKISIIPIDLARPGFEVDYKVIYENQGNVSANGNIQINYPQEVSSYVSSMPALTDDGDVLVLSFMDLLPFEKRELVITMKLNSPIDSPPLTGGTLSYEANIVSNQSEYYNSDNHFSLIQDVVNSFDPNDKTCLQGATFLDEMVGSYIDYLIRFENTGTADAVNITILDKIDSNSFDITTLKITDSSHPVFLKTDNTLAQFVFQDIYLPFEPGNNNGYVAYKIKTRDHLRVGDSLKNTANIFFDFNYPIQTNTTITTVVTDMDGDGFNNLVDCNDNNQFVFPGQIETPYNGIDDDCNPATLDDDLDHDGFLLADDCNDNNPNINPDEAEDTYNGIDDDCDPLTIDDDLDQDGFLLADDCDDNNPNINPDAEEIVNNGIDEDCDGMDLVSSTYEIGNSTINIFPNPTIDGINVSISGNLSFSANLFDLNGKLLISQENSNKINVTTLPTGTYLLEIKDQKTGQKIVEKVIVGQ